MEAVCPHCRMRYEVGEELLQQGTPVLCPTCQVGLTMVHPGTTIPLDQPLEPEAPPAEQAAEAEPPPPEPTEPASGWDSGDLLGTQTDETAADEPPPAEPPPPEASEAGGALSGWGELSEASLPPEPAVETETAADEVPPQAETFADPWDEPTGEPEVEPPEPEVEPPEPEVEPPEPEVEPPEPEVEPPEPEVAPPEPEISPPEPESQAFPEPEIETATEPAEPEPEVPEEPEPQVASFETPTWDPVPEPEPPAPEPAVPDQEPAAETQQPEQPYGQAAPMDDWASAAARWAASGFSTDNMPDFVKAKEDAQRGRAAPVPPSSATFIPPSEPPRAEAEISPTPPFGDRQAALAPQAPPPLPKQPEIALPSPGSPPPLDGRRRSVYVMKGSGEGVRDESAPWAATSAEDAAAQPLPVSAPASQPARAQLDLSAPIEQPVARPAERLVVPKPKRTALWVVLAVLLIGAGGFLAWYFVKKSHELDQDKPGDKTEQAGMVGDTKPDKPPVAVTPDKKDAGQPDAAKEPGKKPEEEVAKTDVKQPAKDIKKPPVRKKKKKVISSKEAAKLAKKQALEYYKQGNLLIRKRDFPGAIKFFLKALKANPKLAQAHRGLGICYAQRRQNKKACREYRIYLKMIPPDSKEVPALRQILKGCK